MFPVIGQSWNLLLQEIRQSFAMTWFIFEKLNNLKSQIFVEILCPHNKNTLMGLKYSNGPQEESSNLLAQIICQQM